MKIDTLAPLSALLGPLAHDGRTELRQRPFRGGDRRRALGN